jgi:hypothetical protein
MRVHIASENSIKLLQCAPMHKLAMQGAQGIVCVV